MVVRLHFTEVEIRANGTALLGPVSLVLETPGITVIMGANGAGKSLFLSAAHGLVTPNSGSIMWNGAAAESSRASRSFVFQSTPLLRRSVAANVAFPLKARLLSRTEKSQVLAAALAEARLGALARKPAATLSGGERKRMALARAMVTGPQVVLLDEPAANLDPASTKELEESLLQIKARGIKIILSTHDIAQARRLADDILFFDQGHLQEQSPAQDFFAAPTTSAAQKYLRGEL